MAATAAEPASTSYSARTEARIDVENVDGLVAAAGAVWAKTDDGRVVRIDPGTNKVVSELTLDHVVTSNRYCQGIGTDGTSVWACATRDDATALAQIDPVTGQVMRHVPAGKLFDQVAIPATDRGPWLLTADGTEASVIEPASGRIRSYPLGVRCLQVAATADRVVATSASDNTVLLLDAKTGSVIKRVTLKEPRIAALAGSQIWVDTAAGLARLREDDLVVQSVYEGLVAGVSGDLFADAGSVWIRGAEGTITRIDAETGRILERIAPEEPVSSGSLIVAFGSIWISENDEGVIVRLRLT